MKFPRSIRAAILEIGIILSRRDQARLASIVLATTALAGIEVASLAIIASFMLLVTDPGQAGGNWLLSTIQANLDPASDIAYAGLVGGVLILSVVLRNIIAAGVTWYRLSVVEGLRETVASRLLASYLSQPFSFFYRINSATIAKNVTHEIDDFVSTYMNGIVLLASDVIVSGAIILFMIVQSPGAALIILASTGALAGTVIVFLKNRLGQMGHTHRKLNETRLKLVNESIGSIKEIRLLRRERYFHDLFSRTFRRLTDLQVRYQLMLESPRYILEVAIIIGLFSVFATLVWTSGSIAQAAPSAAVIVLACYRLTPIAHRIVNTFGSLRFNTAIRTAIAEVLIQQGRELEALDRPAVTPLPFKDRIAMKGVGFDYDNREGALQEIDLTIRAGESIGIVGRSGAGKTTLADVMLGLLEPTAGTVWIDGRKLDSSTHESWSASVAYVPQFVFLTDASLAHNIAFGLNEDEIDRPLVEEVAQFAQLDDLIAQLPDGLDTMIGERGNRLSGGQRQRIGIARAFYQDCALLVLDEATSALDTVTESAIHEAIQSRRGRITQVMIAHRLTTVKACDRIVVMDAGRIVATGDYETLERESPHFRALINSHAGSGK